VPGEVPATDEAAGVSAGTFEAAAPGAEFVAAGVCENAQPAAANPRAIAAVNDLRVERIIPSATPF
jgi:hypothetical protein